MRVKRSLTLKKLWSGGDRLMFMLKEPFPTHYIGFRWTDIDCAKATVKQIKNTEIQFKLDSGFSVTLSLNELEEITIHPLKE